MRRGFASGCAQCADEGIEAGGALITLPSCLGLSRASTSFRRDGKEDADGRVKPGHDEEIDPHPRSTGPPAFFQASIPPSICAVLARPASFAAFTAIAERSP